MKRLREDSEGVEGKLAQWETLTPESRATPETANVVSSFFYEWWDRKEDKRRRLHKVLLDLDVEHTYVPSSTSDHGHLYINVDLSDEDYEEVLTVLVKHGILGQGTLNQMKRDGGTTLRIPGETKQAERIDKLKTDNKNLQRHLEQHQASLNVQIAEYEQAKKTLENMQKTLKAQKDTMVSLDDMDITGNVPDVNVSVKPSEKVKQQLQELMAQFEKGKVTHDSGHGLGKSGLFQSHPGHYSVSNSDPWKGDGGEPEWFPF